MQWHPTPVLLLGKSHGQRSLVGCSPWGPKESDMTERLHFHFSLSCIGEGNGNPLQCSCLENPRDGGASWAAVYGVARSRTRLKRLSGSSSSSRLYDPSDSVFWQHDYVIQEPVFGSTKSWPSGVLKFGRFQLPSLWILLLNTFCIIFSTATLEVFK